MTIEENFLEYWREEHGNPPTKWEICPDCLGEGTSTRYLGAYTQSDREAMGEEWFEFMDDMQAGNYDRPDERCGGTGKVRVFSGEAQDAWKEWQREEAEDRHTLWAEDGYPQ